MELLRRMVRALKDISANLIKARGDIARCERKLDSILDGRAASEKYTLREIAGWQVEGQREVSLPPVQRGFVWKPDQIETLWDSLLRRFPIGSFLFSKTKDGGRYLLDGQQRATSIALGFYNPFSGGMSPWSIKNDHKHLPVVWIDVKPEEAKKPKDGKYLLRVVTQSHPWGYRVDHNKLGISERRKALALFKEHDDNKRKDNERKGKGYTQFANTTYFPVDASRPVPLSFFFEAIRQGSGDNKAVADAVIALCEKYLPPNMRVGDKDRAELIGDLKNGARNDLEQIAQAALDITENTRINYDVLDEPVLMDGDNAAGTGAGAGAGAGADAPTLFVRVNSSGTPLDGDELIYSIYKAAFPGSKDLVENIGMGFIAPSQIVSTAARMAYAASQDDPGYPARVTVQRFQSLVRQDKFKNALTTLIGNEGNSPVKTCFETAIAALSLEGVEGFNDDKKTLMPPVLIKDFVKKNPDLFFLLVYWLSKNGNQKPEPDLARKIAARRSGVRIRAQNAAARVPRRAWRHDAPACRRILRRPVGPQGRGRVVAFHHGA